MIQFRAHFDGKNLCPDEPVSLPEGVTLRVSVADDAETAGPADEIPDHDGWNDLSRLIAQSQISTGISDLAQEHDHYLYGKPKQDE